MQEEIEKIKKIPIVFIVGSIRSGTTLLQSLLNSHPNIIAPPESHFITLFYSRFGKIKNWNDAKLRQFVKAVFFFPTIKNQWLLNEEQLFKKLVSIKDYADYPLLCKMVFLEMRGNKSPVLMLSDKNPINSFFVEKIILIFPDAKFIHLIRYPRDAVNSDKKRLSKKNTFYCAMQWLRRNINIENAKQKEPARFFDIKYEALVVNTEKILQSLCEFLHIPYDSSMLENKFAEKVQFYKGGESLETFKTRNENLLQPINASNIGKFQHEMSERDIAITEKITGKYARDKFGYDLRLTTYALSLTPYLKLFGSQLHFYIWEMVLRLKFESALFNKLYKFIKHGKKPW